MIAHPLCDNNKHTRKHNTHKQTCRGSAKEVETSASLPSDGSRGSPVAILLDTVVMAHPYSKGRTGGVFVVPPRQTTVPKQNTHTLQQFPSLYLTHPVESVRLLNGESLDLS